MYPCICDPWFDDHVHNSLLWERDESMVSKESKIATILALRTLMKSMNDVRQAQTSSLTDVVNDSLIYMVNAYLNTLVYNQESSYIPVDFDYTLVRIEPSLNEVLDNRRYIASLIEFLSHTNVNPLVSNLNTFVKTMVQKYAV